MDLFRYPVIFVTVQRLTSVPLDLLVVQIERRGDSTLESPSSSATRLLIIDNRRLEEILKKWEALRKGSTFEINHHYWWISLVYRLLHSGILCEFWQRDLFFHWKDLKGPLFDISVYLFDHHFVETSLSNWNSVILAAFFAQKASAWSNFMCSKPWCVAQRDPPRRQWKCGLVTVGFGWCRMTLPLKKLSILSWKLTYPIPRHVWVDDIAFPKQ